jgi:hypothetical protein
LKTNQKQDGRPKTSKDPPTTPQTEKKNPPASAAKALSIGYARQHALSGAARRQPRRPSPRRDLSGAGGLSPRRGLRRAAAGRQDDPPLPPTGVILPPPSKPAPGYATARAPRSPRRSIAGPGEHQAPARAIAGPGERHAPAGATVGPAERQLWPARGNSKPPPGYRCAEPHLHGANAAKPRRGRRCRGQRGPTQPANHVLRFRAARPQQTKGTPIFYFLTLEPVSEGDKAASLKPAPRQ